MQGNPLRELILVLVLAALLAPVIFKLTDDPNPEPSEIGPTPEHQAGDLTPSVVRLQFAHAPNQAVLKYAEQAVLEVQAAALGTSFEVELDMDLSAQAIEMPIEVRWPAGTPRTAVTITIEPEGMEAREVTFWAEGELNEWIELNWDE